MYSYTKNARLKSMTIIKKKLILIRNTALWDEIFNANERICLRIIIQFINKIKNQNHYSPWVSGNSMKKSYEVYPKFNIFSCKNHLIELKMRTRNILYYTAVTVYYSKNAILVITVIWCIMTHASRARGSGGGALTETLDRAAARSRPEPAETGARKQSETRETSGRRRTRHAGSKQEQGTIRRECEETTWTTEELTDG